MLSKKLKSKRGFSLLEVIISVFIVAVGIVGITNIIPQIITTTKINTSRLTAAYLAQEGIEIVRAVRDGNFLEKINNTNPLNTWDEGLTNCSAGCEADYACANVSDPDPLSQPQCFRPYSENYLNIDGNFYSYSSGIPTKFARKITITQEGTGDILKVLVDVFWQEKGVDKRFSAEEKIYKWIQE
ncbi:MAG: prepilin-type N-terminal cleavage/methylation domain-containing protein [Candidatus Pacebacteria bacterium]|nr:prepilin-type N-terminal cleavage/methylation domain-containing protein [Candidatus Paceibacterota bacterium]